MFPIHIKDFAWTPDPRVAAAAVVIAIQVYPTVTETPVRIQTATPTIRAATALIYINPELYGVPAQQQIEWARHPELMKITQEIRAYQRQRKGRSTASVSH